MEYTNFYRPTLCGSAVFPVAQCPSVCLSLAFVYCIQTAEDITKFISRSGSPFILVFLSLAPVPIYKERARAQNTRGWENL